MSNHLVPRTCSYHDNAGAHSTPLSNLRPLHAYVLLGEPGAGKSSAFEQEAAACDGTLIRAREFIELPLAQEWRHKTLFIDGLDEMRAGSDDGRKPLDAIRRRLAELDIPPFRISCREADWLGDSDRVALEYLAGDAGLRVLHLDDLDRAARLAILQDQGVIDGEDFLRRADTQGLGDLLGNPLTLKLLADTVGNGASWPETRADLYRLACEKIVQEPNPEHRAAKRGKAVSDADLLNAAGELCAVLLLSGREGVALDSGNATAAYLALAHLSVTDVAKSQRAVQTLLFVADGQDNHRRPIHRTFAEYLAARHLATRIQQHGLPLARVLAWMGGSDGGVVAGLRGLHAWLAVHCSACRDTLIERDPLGVLLYGDAAGFGTADRLKLLRALEGEAKRYPWFRHVDWRSSPFGALGKRDMADALRSYLDSPARDEASQAFLECVLEALIHGEAIPELEPALWTIVRDAGYWPGLRSHALEAWRRSSQNVAPLLELLESIRQSTVEDSDDELLGYLLSELYPRFITPEQLVAFLHQLKQPSLIGSYFMFWEQEVVARTPIEQLPNLLDAVAAAWLPSDESRDYLFQGVIGELIASTLERLVHEPDVKRLAAWLDTGLDRHRSSRLDVKHSARIVAWLTAHPKSYQALILHAVDQCPSDEEFPHRIFDQEARIYDAAYPEGFDEWCLAQAESQISDIRARHFFDKAVRSLVSKFGWERLNIDSLSSWCAARPRFQPWLDSWLREDVAEWRLKHAERKRNQGETDKAKRSDWLQQLRNHIDAIQAGTAPVGIYYDLARAHEGSFTGARDGAPLQRMEKLFEGNTALVEASLIGLRRCVTRMDLPTTADIVDLARKGREHYIRRPCLVGMELLHQDDPLSILALDDDLLLRMLAFRFTYDVGDQPDWLGLLLRERPALVADALVAYATPMLKAGHEHISSLHALAHDPEWTAVATLAAPRLLQALPHRIKKNQVRQLNVLLLATLRHARPALLPLLDARLKLGSLDAGQRVMWLACATLIDPNRHAAALEIHVGSSQTRAAVLASFLRTRWGEQPAHDDLPESLIQLFVRLLAPSISPRQTHLDGWVRPEQETARYVEHLISQLGGRPGLAARQALEALSQDKRVTAWSNEIRHAIESQRVVSREADYRAPEAAALVEALKNGKPANCADLAALVAEQLHEIGKTLRHGDTNGYRRFWIGGESAEPALENECRDYLLDLLRPRLQPMDIEAQKEGYFAEDRRADIRVSYRSGRWIVPVEIKRDRHTDVWRAIGNQLTRYAQDPAAGGYGIYVVLWFGGKGMPFPPSGSRPRTAADVERELQAILTPAERTRISVVVLDVSQ
ncbi:MAG: hypothetical protein A3H93_02885 [Rhodocyclales bacterium RIFCSPLOWO2_02_FULL_63_24]|nr:MAG: hypothetical protein A3H93_02885 [Rhodocyclales bacterium RIFCSPLOWO2_02_FULL_63_24]